MIRQFLYDGLDAVQASNGELDLTLIPGFGSQVISLVHIGSETELFLKPSPGSDWMKNPFLHGIPVLFPPNRIADGTFTFNGKTHHFEINEPDRHNHIHGFVYDKKWTLITAEEREGMIVLETELHLEQPAIYKHASIRMTYEIDGCILRQKARVKNNGSEPFPWGLGYHTTFRFCENVSTFSLTSRKQWALDERALPTGQLTPVEPFQDKRVKGTAFDDAFLAAADRNEAVLHNHETGGKIIYRTDSAFKQWVLYNGNGEEGFVCPEPYTSITNAFNLDMPADLTGLHVLGAGKEVTVETEVEVR